MLAVGDHSSVSSWLWAAARAPRWQGVGLHHVTLVQGILHALQCPRLIYMNGIDLFWLNSVIIWICTGSWSRKAAAFLRQHRGQELFVYVLLYLVLFIVCTVEKHHANFQELEGQAGCPDAGPGCGWGRCRQSEAGPCQGWGWAAVGPRPAQPPRPPCLIQPCAPVLSEGDYFKSAYFHLPCVQVNLLAGHSEPETDWCGAVRKLPAEL